METRRYGTVAEFMASAGVFLEAREAEHNLIFGICSQIAADPTQYEIPPIFLTVFDGDQVVGAAIQTPPWRLVVSVFESPTVGAALATELRGSSLPGAVGTVRIRRGLRRRVARRMPAAPRRSTGTSGRTGCGPSPRHGRRRAAWPRRARRIAASSSTGSARSTTRPASAARSRTSAGWPTAGSAASAGPLYLWHDEGRPVSMAGAGGTNTARHPRRARLHAARAPRTRLREQPRRRRVPAPARRGTRLRLPVHRPRQPDGEQDLPVDRLRAGDRHRRVRLRLTSGHRIATQQEPRRRRRGRQGSRDSR